MKQIKFAPCNDKQKRFLESTKRYLMYSGAVGAGKSLMGCWKGLMLNLMYPGNKGLICRKEARSLQGSTIKTLLEKVLPEEWVINYNVQKGEITHHSTNQEIPSTITFCGLDKRADQTYPTKIGSTEYGWIFIDEGTELEEGDWHMLSTRLRYLIPNLTDKENAVVPRQMFTATNPDAPTHFLYKFFFQSPSQDREVILTNPYENPYLPTEYIRSLEESLTGIARERLLFGKWVQAEGVIYKTFSMEKHIVKDNVFLPIKDYQAVYFGADSNFPLPRAAVIAGIREGGKIDILEEFYQPNAHVEDLIVWLTSWQKKREWTIYGYHDPSDPTAIDKINNAYGLSCEKADNSVIPGISEVSRLFDQGLIRINETCLNLTRELQSYRWKIKKEGDSPRKLNDHLCFVGDTLILTLDGEKKIKDITPRDYVLTRKGWKKVDLQEKTNQEAEIICLMLSDGREIFCTPNHPFWVEGKGWIPCNSLRYLYILVDSLRYLWQTKTLMEGAIIKAQMDTGEGVEDLDISIGTYGNLLTERFQKNITSIISMATKTTMRLQILNASHLKNTKQNTLKHKNKLKRIPNILIELDHSLKNGTQAKKEMNGILNIGKEALRKRFKKENMNVNNAVKSLFRGLLKGLNSAMLTANNPPYVLGVRKLKNKETVYNLYIEDCHEYFANGILVSNCDALRYLCNSIKNVPSVQVGSARIFN